MEEAPCLLTPCGLGADGQAVTHRKVTTPLPLAGPVPAQRVLQDCCSHAVPHGPWRAQSLERSIPGTRLRQTHPPGQYSILTDG